ncbi:DUF3846 domain-containing protein [Streptomyces sp. NPDC021354]|uniref:DUF3846 domain-containing protein n=1 Tax=Streptomyces sp. NPDC021354 TaxID=3154793 RepID=UPI0033C1FC08
MPATATPVETYALWVPPAGPFRLLHWHTTTTPQSALGCDTARPASLTSELTMWTDDDLPLTRRPRNSRAQDLMRAYQPHPSLCFGDALFTGTTGATSDEVHGLTFDQALTLIDLYCGTITHAPGPGH